MRIVRYSSLLDQILNQHKADPIDEVYLNKEEFDSVSNSAIMSQENWDDTGKKLLGFTITYYSIKFILEE